MPPLSAQPVVIIGAPRSGTNLLRDLMCQAPGVVTWPCDEINLAWRHGNVGHPSDDFPAHFARPPVRRYLRGLFETLARDSRAGTVVEKTCANSLRVGFVDAVLPEAKFIYIVRDGRDAVLSAMQRWCAPLDWGYTLRKLRFVPVTDVPRYAGAFVANRLRGALDRKGRLGYWGPKFPGFDAAVESLPLATLCARQWRACVEAAEQGLAQLDPARVARTRYEDLVRDPRGVVGSLLGFAGCAYAADRLDVAHVSTGSIGKGETVLREDGAQDALTEMQPVLRRLSYA